MKKVALFFLTMVISGLLAGDVSAQYGRTRGGVGVGIGVGVGTGPYYRTPGSRMPGPFYGSPYGYPYGFGSGYRLPPDYKFWSGSHYQPAAQYRYGPYSQYDYRYDFGPNDGRYSSRVPSRSYHRPYYEDGRSPLFGQGVIGAPWFSGGTSGSYAYYNPYADEIDDPVYDYTVPIDTRRGKETAPSSTQSGAGTQASQSATDSGAETPSDQQQAMQYFKQARAAFKANDDTRAMQKIDQAIGLQPGNILLHEFRALLLFATGKYTQAAAVIHAALASGPVWNWETMIHFYPNAESYTEQLRKLEDYVRGHRQDAAARFLLAYHYLVMGYPKSAVSQLRHVVELKPKDVLSQRLLNQIELKERASTPTP